MPLAEKALIGRLKLRAGLAPGVLGIGDDCACVRIPPGHEALVTTDFSIENVHFSRKLQPAASIGHRCLLRGLSDVAAMGGIPLTAFLSLALPRKIPQRWVDEFLCGLLKLAKDFGIPLAGGDTALSPGGIAADIVVLGSAPKGKAILRSGAKAGDRIYVTGTLGGAAAILDRMLRSPKRKISKENLSRYFYPAPRIDVGRYLREKGIASAMIDISDGLSTDISHICEESGVGATLTAEKIPLGEMADIDLASHGGEDYELLFTAAAGEKIPRRISNIAVSEIGRIVPGREVRLMSRGKSRTLAAAGWEHFRKRQGVL